MGDRRRQLAGIAVAALLALAAPTSALASPGLAAAVPSLASPAQKPFAAPRPRPTERRARPTDAPDPNRSTYTVPEAPSSPACSLHFCVHWVDEGLDAPSLKDSNGDGVPDYVDRVLQVAEYAHTVENEQLGWREPKSDGKIGGGDGETDIYLAQMTSGFFGYSAPDPGQGSKGHRMPRHLYAYLVLDNDYSAFEFPGTSPIHDLEVTIAHEYNHILQFAYDAYQDDWFAESSAVWMEDQVYGEVNDYVHYIGHWVRRFDTPLTASSIKEYGSAVWNDWLAHRYGRAIVRQAWSRAIDTRPGGFSVNAYESAIRAAGHSDLGHDFARFAAAVAEWRTGKGFSESRLYPDMPRHGQVPLGEAPLTTTLNHTTFELLGVRARGGRAVAVHATAPGGTAAALALVGRIGGEKRGRTITELDFNRSGGRLSVRLAKPGRFSRITAVLVNADARAHGFSARRLDWRYLTDRAPFHISGRIVR
jgi:hypothetical protein